MRRSFVFSFLLLCLLNLSLPAQTQDTPLQLIDRNPVAGAPLTANEPVTLRFSEPLDCATAESAVSIVPDVAGEFVCSSEGATLAFVPDTGFESGVAYALTVEPTLASVSGMTLGEPLTLYFSTEGYLAVSELIPADGSLDVAAQAVITVVFNRPVVPLVIAEDMPDLPQPITISPPVEGEGEWVSTFVYTFQPDEGFEPNTSYTVTVDPTLETPEGVPMLEPASTTFETVRPQIMRVWPERDDKDVWLDPVLSVRFNVPLERQEAEDAFYLRPLGATDQNLSGEFEWAENNVSFEFTPDTLLELDTIYVAGFDGVVGVQESDLKSWLFTTVPYPEFIGHYPEDGDEVSAYNGFTLEFNTFMDSESIDERLTIEPEPLNISSYRSGMTYRAAFPAQASTTYRVRVEPGYTDAYGNPVDTAIEFDYTTLPFPPSYTLRIPRGPVGFYNANNDVTALYVQHRNVEQLGVQLNQVPLDEFVNLVIGEGDNTLYNYEPADEDTLRRWRVDLQGPENTYTPSLLTLGATESCPIAVESRFNLGMKGGVVVDQIDALDAPVDGSVRANLYEGFEFEIIGGPDCRDDALWWEADLGGGLTAWIEEALTGDITIDRADSMGTTGVPITDMDSQSLDPGVYYLRVNRTNPEDDPDNYRSHFMMVMNANLTVKSSFDSVTVWATDVQTGEPIAGEWIDIYDSGGFANRGMTDESGLLTLRVRSIENLSRSTRVAVLASETYTGVGASYWADGIDPGMFDQPVAYGGSDYVAYIYTDRPMYRPGETVYFKGVVRSKDDMSYTPPDDFDSVLVTTNNGEERRTVEVDLTPFGSFSGEIKLGEDMRLGGYSIEASIPRTATEGRLGRQTFTVAEFRLPEFEVDVLAAEDDVAQGDTIQVAVDSRYFFGGPVSNANVDWQVVAQPYFFNYTGTGRYRFYDYFSDYRDFGFNAREVATGTGTTDDSGVLMVELPADLGETIKSQRFQIEATVRDESDQIVSGRSSVNVHAGDYYIGTRPERYVSYANQESTINMILVDWESNPIPNQNVDVRVVEIRWSNVQERDEQGRTVWKWESEEIPVTEGEVTTDDQGQAVYTFTPPRGGSYQVIFSTLDEQGNEITNAARQWISSREYVSWRQNNDNRIDIIADQESYHVGDTAQILIASPFQGTTRALVTVERDGVMQSETIVMDNNSYVYELPIEPDFAPNVFVSVMLIKGVDETNPVASFRMGLIKLDVDTGQKVISIDIASDTERAQPQETVTYSLRTTDYKGDPVQAEVGVALTDAAALAISGPNAPTLLDFFYSEQGLGVRTATPLTINTDEITQQILNAVKGGGGGGGGGGMVLFDVREDFVSTPYWNATVTTDENGEATFEVKLPDNLTTWRLDARAVTSGDDGLTLVGQETYDILSTRPLIVRPVTPRFFVVDDQLMLAAVVNNNTGEDLEVDVTLESTGLTVDAAMTQRVTIPADGRARVEWPITVEQVENIELIFYAASADGEYTDASRPAVGQGEDRLLPVYRYEVPETVGTSGVLRAGGERQETIMMPQDMSVSEGELTIRIQQSLAATTIDGLDYLKNYPHQCIEQTVSRFLPNIMTYRALDDLGLADAELESNLTESVDMAVQKLYNEQKPDGGWGWFLSESSHPTTTAYALIGLVEAREQGFQINPDVIFRAQEYLKAQFVRPSVDVPTYRLNRQAFILYALARAGEPDIGRTSNLYDYRERLNLDARAFLALTLHIIDPENTSRTDVLLSDFNNAAVISATGLHWEEGYRDYWNWGSNLRSTALVLDALVTLRPESDLIPQAVRWLMVQRENKAWSTTQETAWSVMALTDWMVVSGELQPDYDYSLSFNGESRLSETATQETIRQTDELVIQVAEMLMDEANRLLFERTEGNGALYYTAHLRLFLPVPEVEALDRGIIVRRQYTLAGDEDQTPITEARIGETVQVKLTIVAPSNLHYVVIEDPIPAGAEAINPRLSTSQQIGTQPNISRYNSRWGWGWWYFRQTEYKDEKVRLYASYLPAGTYEFSYTIRPGLPGTYNVIPTTANEFYFPEVYGRSDGMEFTILSADE